jgi:hypothetical protein
MFCSDGHEVVGGLLSRPFSDVVVWEKGWEDLVIVANATTSAKEWDHGFEDFKSQLLW